MQLTWFTDYGLRLLLYAAAHPDRRVTVAEVASAYQISRDHLMKVSQRLTQLEIILATRGRGGGVQLALDPANIRLGAVVRALEPDLNLVECFSPLTNTCRISPACRLKGALFRARRAFLDSLDEHTLADVVGDPDALRALWASGPPGPEVTQRP
ncbi:MAG: Rrf2 family transcriptional regulator [Deltaproteobacteria bacterium]|nr:Rrf2 family transcriptional regulator [Deltaproteobacteria bacterium]